MRDTQETTITKKKPTNLNTQYLNKMDHYSFFIERGKLQEFCLAISETKPIYTDKQAAQEEGYKDTPVTPTFLTTVIFWGYPQVWTLMEKVGFNLKRVVHLKENTNYYKTLYPETMLQVEIGVVDIKDGKMQMATVRANFKDEEGELCTSTDMVITMRPE